MRTISLDIKHIYTSKVLNNIKSYLYACFKKYRKMCCTHFDTIIFTGDEIRKKIETHQIQLPLKPSSTVKSYLKRVCLIIFIFFFTK